MPKDQLTVEPGAIRILVPDDPPQYSDLRFRRGLHRIAFNYLAWKLGPEALLDAHSDNARRYIRRARRGEVWPYVQRLCPEFDGPRGLRLSLLPGEGHRIRFQCFYDGFYVSLSSPATLHAWPKASPQICMSQPRV